MKPGPKTAADWIAAINAQMHDTINVRAEEMRGFHRAHVRMDTFQFRAPPPPAPAPPQRFDPAGSVDLLLQPDGVWRLPEALPTPSDFPV